MKANELRIGNWALTRSGEKRLITSNEIKSMEYYEQHKFTFPPPFKPIPLTEEWLQRSRLIQTEARYKFPDNEWFSVEMDGVWCSLYCNNIYYAVDFKYVHELQNLYFALTGHEL